MTATHAEPAVQPWRNQAFHRLFSAQVIALIGTGLSTVALTLLAYDISGSHAAAVLGTALACKMLAYVFFAPVLGGLAHRFSRKPFLISMDLARAALILLMPWVTEAWQIYLLVFVLNLFSAGFTPVFSATIPDLLPDERTYTRALSMSRLAYDLESLLSPVLAGIALLALSYSALFGANALAFCVSAALIWITVMPNATVRQASTSLRRDILFGLLAYLKTPRLRALLALYLGVAAASAMVIVNTIIYIKEDLARSSTDVAFALAAAGAGSMLAALSLPKLLDHLPDRPLMLSGGVLMTAGVASIASRPEFAATLSIWLVIGVGWSLVQTPAGRLVTRSASKADRSAYFSAQFALSHTGWLLFYPVAGYLGSYLGVPSTALVLALAIAAFTTLAWRLWPNPDPLELPHSHDGYQHSHTFVIDSHHPSWPSSDYRH